MRIFTNEQPNNIGRIVKNHIKSDCNDWSEVTEFRQFYFV